MPVDPRALTAKANRHVCLEPHRTPREALARLQREPSGGQPWWHLVVRRSDGTWAAIRFLALYEALRRDPVLLDWALETTKALAPVEAVEGDEVTTAEATRRARSARRPVVVTRGGELAGIVCASGERSSIGGAVSQADLAALATATPYPLRRFTDVSCPSRVALEERHFTAVVRLTLEPPPWSDAAVALDLPLDHPVTVRLEAPGFRLFGGAEREIPLLRDRDSPPAVFDLAPLAAGRHRLAFDLFQRTHPLGTLGLTVEVVAGARPGPPAKVAPQRLPSLAGVPPPERVLHVAYESDPSRLVFSLLEGGGASWRSFPAVRLQGDPAAFADHLLGSLDTLSLHGVDPTALAASGRGVALGPDQVDKEIRTLGRNLWNLLPMGLRQLYAEERTAWRGASLMILSDEPYLPWELLWPYGDDWEDPEPWSLSLALSRWLRRGEEGRGNAGALGNLPLGTLAGIIPDDSGLPATRHERDFLRELEQRHALADLSPSPATLEAVMELFEAGGFDWVHLASHGSSGRQLAGGGAALWLTGGRAITAGHLVGPGLERHFRHRRAAFLLNACHGAQGSWSLMGLGGWASRLLGLGAGLFLGPLWTVPDQGALALVRAFYGELEVGAPVAFAMQRARRALREGGDPTWAAYSLYAHPHARVSLGPPGGSPPPEP